MIRINRSKTPPRILISQGQKKATQCCVQYDTNPATYSSKGMSFERHIYSHASVRKELKECQHNKCCYSEGRFVGESVHIEHFRPKGAIGERGAKRKHYPGYYWLAYKWTNLLACKAALNSKKGDHFPLVDETMRARNHHDDLCLETPMFIDPASEDPRKHIQFHNEEPYGITKRGKFTVEWLLRHPSIDEDRREYFQMLDTLKKILESKLLSNGTIDESTQKLTRVLVDAVEPHAQYSSMATDLIGQLANQLRAGGV